MATGTDGSSLRLRLGHPRRFYNYDNNSMIIFSYSARDRSHACIATPALLLLQCYAYHILTLFVADILSRRMSACAVLS
jgi:hypothetical protein